MSYRSTHKILQEVQLTDAENQLCCLLDECTRFLQEEHNITTSCRIAGGWVRDKLLGEQSNDIDIALTDMMGAPFAEHFISFVSQKKNIAVGKVAKIQSNPGQSKHLETARTTIFEIELDFVNLRSEEYAEDSRIPTEVRFGTPLQDALRRDITINALFYNIHSRSVEDHTGQGLPDLRDGIIRTPLAPLETFKDDPLRVIRCIRFASRFGFRMLPELKQAAQDATIQAAIFSKISRERVGEEIDKMMKGPDPVHSAQLIDELSLYPSIFSIPLSIMHSVSSPPSSYGTALVAATFLHELRSSNQGSCSTLNLPSLHPTVLLSASDPGTRARLYLAAILHPYAGYTYEDRKGKKHQLVEAAVREGLKLGTKNHYLDGIPALFVASDIFKNPSMERLRSPSERVAIGLLLREKNVHNPHTGSHWATSLFYSLICELVSLYDMEMRRIDGGKAKECIQAYNDFVTRIEELGLQDSVDAKPILDGKDVVEILGGNKPGPWTGVILDQVSIWQLEHPNGTKKDCEAWLKRQAEEGAINVEKLIESVGAQKRVQNAEKSTIKKMKR